MTHINNAICFHQKIILSIIVFLKSIIGPNKRNHKIDASLNIHWKVLAINASASEHNDRAKASICRRNISKNILLEIVSIQLTGRYTFASEANNAQTIKYPDIVVNSSRKWATPWWNLLLLWSWLSLDISSSIICCVVSHLVSVNR